MAKDKHQFEMLIPFFLWKNVNRFPDLSKPRISDWIMSNFRTGTSVFPTFSSGSADTLKLLASSGSSVNVSHDAARKMARGLNVASRTKPLSFNFSFRRSFFTKPTPWKGYKTSDNLISWTGPNFHKLISVGNKWLK